MGKGKPIDLTGKVFNRITVIALFGTVERGRTVWICKCSCGNEIITRGRNLTKGHKQSCGCLTKATYTHHSTGTRLHGIWRDMKQRCLNPKYKFFKNYGGRGITISKEWIQDFKKFKDWALENGYSEDLTIDRKDNNGNYEPNNCRWVPWLIQAYNKRTTLQVSINGETLNLLQIEQKYGVPREIVRNRIKSGWAEQDIINPKHRFRPVRK